MAIDIIDRRKTPKGKSLVNRQRFLKRHHRQVREAIQEKICHAGVKEIASEQPKKVKIGIKGTEQPVFHHGPGGANERVFSGNREFIAGDTIPRPSPGAGDAGSEGAQSGTGEDAFIFEISQKEFLTYFFEDLALPDLVKKALSGEAQFRMQRAGYATDGVPNNLDVLRTMRQSQARRLAFRLPKQRRQRRLEAEREALEVSMADASQLAQVQDELQALDRQLKAIPFLDDIDLRYRRHELVPVPISQAVMFCLMDVAGSMGQWEKEMAKRFFMLLYLFLSRNYDKVELVFIRHHHEAKEVDENEFFYSRESGGRMVSTALRLMHTIAGERYPLSRWNICGCQASDGDNFGYDLPVVQEAMLQDILPLVQYFAYVEVDKQTDSQLWPVYESVRDDDQQPELEVTAIHNDEGYRQVRKMLAEQHDISLQDPIIEVGDVDRLGDRGLTLRHCANRRRQLDTTDANKVLLYTAQLWGFPVELEVAEAGQVQAALRVNAQEVKVSS